MKSPKPLKVAFVGGSYESAIGRTHRVAIELDQRLRLVAGVFSRNPDISRATSIEYGLEASDSYESIDAMLEGNKELDAVIILTPQDQHLTDILTCLDGGIPVICEKALVSTLKEGDKIKESLKANNGFLAVTYNYTGYPMIRELRRMVSDGYLGKIQQIHMEMPLEGFSVRNKEGQATMPQSWRLKDGDIPTLSLDLGSHLHMMGQFLIEEKAKRVVATSSTLGSFKSVVDNVSCLVKYSNEVDGSIWYGKTALGYRNGQRVRIFGSRGSAEWVQSDPENLYIADAKGNKYIVDRGSPGIKIATKARYQRFKVGHPAGFIEAFANYYFDVADSLVSHLKNKQYVANEYVFGLEESLDGLSLLTAISTSAESEAWETVCYQIK